MKTRFCTLLALLALAATGLAEEVAVLDIRTGKEKALQRIVIGFDEAAAPGTVANFKKLVRSGFYNGTAFHRVFPGQMIQGGDPLSRGRSRRNVGTGGPGYTLPPEISKRKHVAGTVAAARLPDKTNPDRVSNGSQFYITLTPMPSLDGQYTIFGKVVDGLDVVNTISQSAADTNDNPVKRVVIRRAKIYPSDAIPALPQPRKGFFGFFR